MTTDTLTIALPPGARASLERLAKDSGVSVEELVSKVAVDRLLALAEPEAYIHARAAKADLAWFDRFMVREGGASPAPGDERD